jgi:hypothetical protein
MESSREAWGLFRRYDTTLEAIKQVARLLNLDPAEPSKVESEQVKVTIDVPL